MICVFFFFQAEDGIRDWSVTGVQTCALPILEEHVQDHGHRGKEISCHKHYCLPNSSARFVAASTADINAARTPPASRACSPAMVVPPGEATLSFSWPGCSLVSSWSLAAPNTVWAASESAVSRGTPTFPTPS